jgi:pullulanase/glycogen debranching enzyme
MKGKVFIASAGKPATETLRAGDFTTGMSIRWVPQLRLPAQTSACSPAPRPAWNCCSSTGRTSSPPRRIIELDPRTQRTYRYWHVFVPGVNAGQLYGYRVYGPSDPARGMRFDSAKVLLDPYGRSVVVPPNYRRQAAAQPGENTATAMKSVLADPSAYDWEGDEPLHRPLSRTIIYEMHVSGFTRHPTSEVAEAKRGTYAGLVVLIDSLVANFYARDVNCRG